MIHPVTTQTCRRSLVRIFQNQIIPLLSFSKDCWLTAVGLFLLCIGQATPPVSLSKIPLHIQADTTLITATICANETYVFNGQLVDTAGTYTTTYTTTAGNDSVVTLRLQVNPVPVTTLRVGICDSSFYVFQGDTLRTSGTYRDTLNTQASCDSIIILQLHVAPFFDVQIQTTLCAGETYIFGGDTLQLPGIYVDSLTARGGCDSTVTLQLSVLPAFDSTLNVSICAGNNYVFNGDTLSLSGVYADTLSRVNGCDSIITLRLTVLPIRDSITTVTVCFGETYTFNGATLTETNNYDFAFTAANGCDSIFTVALTVLSLLDTTIQTTLCAGETYYFGGDTLRQSGVYRDTLLNVNGCDSTVTLELLVLPVSSSTFVDSVCSGGNYVFAGIPIANVTNSASYQIIFTGANGCDSVVTLVLNVLPVKSSLQYAIICSGEQYIFNGDTLTESGLYSSVLTAVNGCDSTAMIGLIVRESQSALRRITICTGDSYIFQGDTLTVSGTYMAAFSDVNGCPVADTLVLTVVPFFSLNQAATICAGETYSFGGSQFVLSGVYTDSLTSASGCDSIVTLTLTVLPVPTINRQISACANEPYLFNGQMLSQSGTYVDSLTTATGCDSIIILQLTVVPVLDTSLFITVCAGESYTYSGAILDVTGDYPFTFASAAGCDSTVTVYLTVLPAQNGVAEVTICQGTTYEFNGMLFDSAGVYTTQFISSTGCDSTVVLTLQVTPANVSSTSLTICGGDSVVFNNQILTTSGTYQIIYPNVTGCDSILNLQLTVLPVITPVNASVTICPGDTFLFNGQPLMQAGFYTGNFTNASGCDSTVNLTVVMQNISINVTLQNGILMAQASNATFQWYDCNTQQPVIGATGNTFTPIVSGSYAVEVTQNGCSRLSACTQVTIVATAEPAPTLDWTLQPNPAYTEVYLTLPPGITESLQLTVYDPAGRVLRQQLIGNEQTTPYRLELSDLPDGVLFIRLSDKKHSSTKRLVKTRL